MTNLVSMNLPVSTTVGPVPPGDPDVTSDPAASFADLLAGVVTTDPDAAPADKRDKLADAVDADAPARHLHPVPVDPSALTSAAVPISAMASPAPAPASNPSPAPSASPGTDPTTVATSAIDTAATAPRPAAETAQVGSAAHVDPTRAGATPSDPAATPGNSAATQGNAAQARTTEDAAAPAPATVSAPVATALAELSRASGVAKNVDPARPTATASPSVKPVAAAAPNAAVSPTAHPVPATTHGTGTSAQPATTNSYAAVAPLVAPTVATNAGSPGARATADADAPAKAVDTTAAPVTGLAGGPTAPTTLAPAAATPPTQAAELRSFPEVQQPLVASLARLRSHAGTHALTVHLHPADLGAVSVNATVRDGALIVSVACADQDAHAAVQAALPNLHQELKNAGFSGVDVSLGNQAQPQARHWLAEHGPGHAGNPVSIPEHPDASGPRPAATVHRRPSTNAGIDRWM